MVPPFNRTVKERMVLCRKNILSARYTIKTIAENIAVPNFVQLSGTTRSVEER